MEPAHEIDQLTLRRAQRGESDAWRVLVATYQRRVYGLCRRIIGRYESSLAQDAAQETFMDVFAHVATFSSSGTRPRR
jgi:DNA-directed RNA polymerase specialized sigma24 family protein